MRLALASFCLLASASGAELLGYVSDEACGWNNAREGKEAKECARVCVHKGGWPPVFVLDGGMKAYKIPAKAERDRVMPFVGDHVAIVGEIKGENVVVRSVRLAPVKPGATSKKK